MKQDYITADCSHGLCAKGCGCQNKQLNTFDYLADIPGNMNLCNLVEVQFKNTRKAYFRNDNHLELIKGDFVAVEASPGHDIGVVTLTGQLVNLQIKKSNIKVDADVKRIYRKARAVDLEKYEEAKSREQVTMIRSRKISKELGLEMKIGDVEYQGDGNKAIFYYIAEGRVDFRKLIKVLADEFHVRIEMKQIGVRQEAGRIGGIGPCGRELCCATWMKDFNTVSTAAVRFQDISPNPQKLAGQCGKLKCCLNYEVDAYMEALKKLPAREINLEGVDGTYYFFKADILSGMITYSTDKRMAANLVILPSERVFEIIQLNKEGVKPEKLDLSNSNDESIPVDLLAQESLTRFDKKHKYREKGKKTNKNSFSYEPSCLSMQNNKGNRISENNKERKHHYEKKKKNKPSVPVQRDDSKEECLSHKKPRKKYNNSNRYFRKNREEGTADIQH